jgi:hypothetical protein
LTIKKLRLEHEIMAWVLFFQHSFNIVGIYSFFHQFRQAEFANGGSILSLSQFLLLLELPLKTMFAIKVVKIDWKIIISLP